jgi:Uma2 family endonuclease
MPMRNPDLAEFDRKYYFGRPDDLPQTMTWEQLMRLPEETARQIELWDGRVVWCRTAPPEHQRIIRRFANALERWGLEAMQEFPDECWKVDSENNLFFGTEGYNDFVTPDFMLFGCLGDEKRIRAFDVRLVGEVLSKANTEVMLEAKKARYAAGGIPWYWEVKLRPSGWAVHSVDCYGLTRQIGELPDGVKPLHEANYVLVDRWTPKDDPEGIEVQFPIPMRIPWDQLGWRPAGWEEEATASR